MSHLNPYAFPTETMASELRSGMTLRDYFAAKAMQTALMTVKPGKGNTFDDVLNQSASVAYEVADAMLKARQA